MTGRNKLSGKTALITGAGRGIGQAAAILFAKNGSDLILVSRTESQLKATSDQCRKHDVQVYYKAVDIGEFDQIDILFDDIKTKFPTIDILVNNAAIFDSGAMDEYDPGKLNNMMHINVIAALYMSQKVLPMMKKAGGGSIVNISSLSGCFGVEKFPGFGAYNISKYALWGLTEIMALENKKYNIRVNQISPAGVDTEMFRKAVPPDVEAELSPDDVARQILCFASDESRPLTGENVMLTEKPE